MTKLLWIALCGLALAGCAADHRNTSASGGSSATTAPNTAPGDEGDRQKPAGSTAPRSAY